MLYSVIMAGGSGTRFWPLSRRAAPKQAMGFLGGESLFQRALARTEGLSEAERTLVVTTAEQAGVLAEQAGGLPARNVVGEPEGRDSAAAIFLAAAIIAQEDSDAVMLVKPADHLISPVESFQRIVGRAVRVAEEGGLLVTFGITPRRPETGYGYIERGARIAGVSGAYEVLSFREKPGVETAREYIEAGRYYWNSGMFVWRARDILDAAAEYAPEHFAAIAPLGELFGTADFAPSLEEAYGSIEKISIDYAVMEKAANVAVVEADFEWSDVGSPTALLDCLEKDASGNVCEGMTLAHGSSGNVIVSDEEHLVAAVGCEGIVIIHTADATLVCPAERVQEIKGLVAEIERRDELERFL